MSNLKLAFLLLIILAICCSSCCIFRKAGPLETNASIKCFLEKLVKRDKRVLRTLFKQPLTLAYLLDVLARKGHTETLDWCFQRSEQEGMLQLREHAREGITFYGEYTFSIESSFPLSQLCEVYYYLYLLGMRNEKECTFPPSSLRVYDDWGEIAWTMLATYPQFRGEIKEYLLKHINDIKYQHTWAAATLANAIERTEQPQVSKIIRGKRGFLSKQAMKLLRVKYEKVEDFKYNMFIPEFSLFLPGVDVLANGSVEEKEQLVSIIASAIEQAENRPASRIDRLSGFTDEVTTMIMSWYRCLASIKTDKAISLLGELLRKEEFSNWRSHIIAALGGTLHKKAIAILKEQAEIEKKRGEESLSLAAETFAYILSFIDRDKNELEKQIRFGQVQKAARLVWIVAERKIKELTHLLKLLAEGSQDPFLRRNSRICLFQIQNN